MLELRLLDALMLALGLVRWLLGLVPRGGLVLHLPVLAPLLAGIGRLRARQVFLKARHACPAYAQFLAAASPAPGRRPRFADVPITSKTNYVQRYSIEARCYGGRIAGGGMVIDESSGSSGAPNNWVRSRGERRDVKRILSLAYGQMYGGRTRMILNCFALGPWATGMNVSMSLADSGVLKSIGPDAHKLETTLATFGPGYDYLVLAYPPFAGAFLDGVKLDLSGYRIDLVVGGEGISEPLRTRLLRVFRSVVSSYGASDLEINIAVETAFTIALRRRCLDDPALSTALFGRDRPPMIFQYNPLDFWIEPGPEGRLLYTVCRVDGAAPKVRYDLKDVGGTWTHAALERTLRAHGVAPADLAARRSAFPLLYVFGRGDLTVAFYGAKLYPTDFEAVFQARPSLATVVRGFQFAAVEDAAARRSLEVHVELVPSPAAPAPDALMLRDALYDGLAEVNQDFREVRRMFGRDALVVTVHACGTGPFAGADDRIKRKYIADAPARPA